MINKQQAIEQFKEYVVYDTEGWDSVSTWDDNQYEIMLTNVMMHLEKTGGVEFAVLKDAKLGKWWAKKSKELARERKRQAALEKLKATMTSEELEILRIKL